MSNANQLAVAAAVVITPFHKDMFAACQLVMKAVGTMESRMQALVTSKYGKVAPTYAQFRADRAALKSLADEKGLTSDQWVRKPYNAAIKAVFGALPESQSASSIAKRKLAAAKDKVAGKAGAKKGETAPRRTGTPETIEQYVARVGVFKVLEACAAILESDEATKDAGHVLRELKAA